MDNWSIERYNHTTHQWDVLKHPFNIWINPNMVCEKFYVLTYQDAVKIIKFWSPYVDLANFRVKHVESGNVIPSVLIG